MRANVVDVDIPEERSQFDELKTLTEIVGNSERVVFRPCGRAAGPGANPSSLHLLARFFKFSLKILGRLRRETAQNARSAEEKKREVLRSSAGRKESSVNGPLKGFGRLVRRWQWMISAASALRRKSSEKH